MNYLPFLNQNRSCRIDKVSHNSLSQRLRQINKKASACPSPGYLVANERFYRLWNLFLLAVIGVLALPVMGILYILLRFTQRSPIFYKGIRLGRDKKPFMIYKFRTLALDAEMRTQNCVLPPRSGLETRLGKFLRDSRLDELPQLFNILRGDMNFFGPRPVRHEIARQAQRTIVHYNRRFSVKPGLVGYAQVFMTHRTPKVIRARFNSYFCRRKALFWKEPIILALTVWGMARKGFKFIKIRIIERLKAKMIHTQRQEPRFSFDDVKLDWFVDHDTMRVTRLEYVRSTEQGTHCLMMNINDEAFAFLSPVSLDNDEGTFLLQRCIKRSRNKLIKAMCRVDLVPRDIRSIGSKIDVIKRNGGAKFKHMYLAYYKPVRDFDAYIIDKYFLGNSILI